MYDKNKNSNKIIKYRILLVILLVAVMVSSVLFFIFRNDSNESSSAVNSIDSSELDNQINFEPPTEEEKNSGNGQKEDIVNNSSNIQPTSNAEVIIVDATQYGDVVEVRAFVSNIISDGSCTITFSKEGDEFSKESDALPDASTTTCITNDVAITEFSKSGIWDVEVRYNGNNVTGVSSTTIEVRL